MFIEIIPNWHPIFVHFTIALFSIATLLIVGGVAMKNKLGEKILDYGYANLWLGALFTIATVAAGLYAYNTVAHDEPSHMAMTDHRNWAFLTASIFLILAIWSIKLFRSNKKRNPIFIGSLLIATTLLSITGWKGGEVVYRYGLGVMSLPNADAHQHTGGEMPADHAAMHNAMPAAEHEEMMKAETASHAH